VIESKQEILPFMSRVTSASHIKNHEIIDYCMTLICVGLTLALSMRTNPRSF